MDANKPIGDIEATLLAAQPPAEECLDGYVRGYRSVERAVLIMKLTG
jgi:hypothetical protein